MIRCGIRLDWEREPTLKHPIRTLAEESAETGGSPGFFGPPEHRADPEEIIAAAQKAGIADEFDGIPLAQKLRRMRRLNVDLVLACCFDDDPYTTGACAVLRERTDAVISGLVLAAHACGARENRIAVFSRSEAGRIRRINPQADLIAAPDRYPARAILKRFLQAGGKRTAYLGAQACAALAVAVDGGEPQRTTVVTVAGPGVENWANLRVRIGTPLKILLDSCGLSEKTKMVVTGSCITGQAQTDLSVPVTARTRCAVALTRLPGRRIYPCIGCGRCARACPRGILPWLIVQEMRRARPEPLRLTNAQKCIGCAACSVVCPAGIDLAGTVDRAAEIRKGVERI